MRRKWLIRWMRKLKAYCIKHDDCYKCVFGDKDGFCMFEHKVPFDWEYPEEENEKDV